MVITVYQTMVISKELNLAIIIFLFPYHPPHVLPPSLTGKLITSDLQTLFEDISPKLKFKEYIMVKSH